MFSTSSVNTYNVEATIKMTDSLNKSIKLNFLISRGFIHQRYTTYYKNEVVILPPNNE